MLSPLIHRQESTNGTRAKERGFTMALVAVALVAIIAMAALSIDIGTLYEAKSEAQRSADAAALTAARVISISGITGDPGNSASTWGPICGGATSLATLAAIKIAQQNLVAGLAVPPGSVTVTYGAGSAGGALADCIGLGGSAFGVNPLVTVAVQRTNLPTFFARVFSLFGSTYANSVSATATAEGYNPSGSGTVAPGMIPVNPRCVKPWIVPNVDPGNSPNPLVNLADGSIFNPGLFQVNGGVIGETFPIGADCAAAGANCQGLNLPNNPPAWTAPPNPPGSPPALVLEYIPALVSGNVGAAPSCAATPGYETAIVGCDQSTTYACGTPNGAQADLTVNRSGAVGETSNGAQCLINQSVGEDNLDPTAFPFVIRAGSGSPVVKAGVFAGDVVTTSNSIVTLPIYDGTPLAAGPTPPVTIVGFLQVFINNVDNKGNLNVTVLNVAGCSNTAGGRPTVAGTSPVPVRLITPP